MSTGHSQERLIVNFHGIGEPWDGVPDAERRYWCRNSDWQDMADALAELAADGAVEVGVTFDDGNLSDIESGLPALLDRGLSATFHVCAGRIGQPRYLDADHLRVMRAAGMRIGCHGWHHVDLRRLDDAELRTETEDARIRIIEACGGDVTEFAIPFGSYDRRVLDSLRRYGAVYTSDRMRAPLRSWLTPRMSYVKDWRSHDLHRFAVEPYSIGWRARQSLSSLLKRLR